MSNENTTCPDCNAEKPIPHAHTNIPPKAEVGEFEKALASLNFEGMARAWHEGDIKWHAAEWKQFVERIRREEREAIQRSIDDICRYQFPIMAEHEFLDTCDIYKMLQKRGRLLKSKDTSEHGK